MMSTRKTNGSPKQQNNTLLNYFSKTQSTPKSGSQSDANSSPKVSADAKLKNGGEKSDTPVSVSASTSRDANGRPLCAYELHDLVWAKLEGYPWWPSIVCEHPTTNSHVKLKGKTVSVHVQFFDDPVSRSWIRLRDLKDYNGKFNSDVPLLKDPKWNTAVEFADQALKMAPNERWTLIADLRPSDEDEDYSYLDVSFDDEPTRAQTNAKHSPKTAKESPKSSLQSPSDGKQKPHLKRKVSPDEKKSDVSKKSKKSFDDSSNEFEDESEDDYKPGKSDEESSDEDIEELVSEEVTSDNDIELLSDEDVERRKTNKTKNQKSKANVEKPLQMSKTSKSVERKKSDNKTKSKSRLSLAEDSFISVDGNETEQSSSKAWAHLGFEFLKPAKIKDKNGRYKSDSDYDATTLSIPSSFLNDQTPAHRQWWDFKAKNFDTILFFKMGKFYELFHMDAVIAANELQITFMRGDYCHCGFPEKSYKRYADVLIQKGYKVARIEQTETPAMMEERCKKLKKPTKFDKVVKRELCRISTIGTRTCSVIDADSISDGNSYLLAIAEIGNENRKQFGVCFIDTSIGRFNIGHFDDDRYCSRLQTLMAHFPPVEIIFNRKNVSPQTKHLLDTCVPTARKEILKENWEPNETLKYLENFDRDLMVCVVKLIAKELMQSNESDFVPSSMVEQLSSGARLSLKSLGALIIVMKRCLIVDEILSMKLFTKYEPTDTANSERVALPERMILDSFTLRNLEIFENSLGGTEGTLFEVLDLVATPFGKRLLQSWLCAPLCSVEQIEERQQAVSDLLSPTIRCDVEETIKELKKLPDLERLLSKIHAHGSAKRAKTHPDSRAIMFELDLYSKRKITDFMSVLNGFKESQRIVENFKKHINSFKSKLLINCLTFDKDGGIFPHLEEKLEYFDKAFDHKRAKLEGKIFPQTGVDDEYDKAVAEIKSITKQLDDYLIEQRKHFNCKVVYFGSGKNRFQLEVPESASKMITKDDKQYELQSSRKGFKRYSTPFIKRLFDKLVIAEDVEEVVLQDIMRRIFETFDKYYEKWSNAVKCLSLLDVLISFYKCRNFLVQNGSSAVLPKLSNSKTPFISALKSSHPCLLKYCDNFVANDIHVEDELVLLTGPNMGGKSTLMRQLALIVVMAQIGSFVPAEECILTPVDRIFTRIGAFDRIVEGESTFFVELSETSMILKHSTKNSLVLIDELGRGTSTFDGTAIACAVANELCTNIKCRTLFSTHYHSLVDEFKNNPSVKLAHMACAVENESETDPTQECITFLYKLKAGSCPKSYGFNAARLAGIPEDIVRNAFKNAKLFEQRFEVRKAFKRIADKEFADNDLKTIVDYTRQLTV